MKTILVTGGDGQLGRALKRQANAWQSDINFIFTDSRQGDITNWDEIRSLIHMVKPDAIINCAAYTRVDQAETEENRAFLVNTVGAGYLAQAAYELGIPIVYPSTDYVFDGEGIKSSEGNIRPYREYDLPNPQSVYGRTKLMGEEITAKHNPRHYIIRTAWLYGEGNNFVKAMIKASRQGVVKVVEDQIGCPTSAMELARAILELIKTGQYGLYHGVCQGSCSRYQLAKEIFRECQIPTTVIPIKSEEFAAPAPRPRYSVLENYKLNLTTSIRFRHWKEALAEYLYDIRYGI